MSFWDILGTLLIKPLQLLFEVVFVMANRVVGDPGLAIIALSLAMNFLVLPLYRRADAMQEEERETELRLHKGVAHIKKTFRGDERMMMLQTYYRQNNYKPTYVLKGATSLFLEIPFFIAAYAFLSNLELLHGVSFGPIRDLGAPDGLLTVAGVTVNVLPFLMTAINLVSCVIFTKGSLPKTKVQLYTMALFFLVFLYTSPAGLVFYWTLNNLFSLLKTIFYKLRHAHIILGVLFSLAGIAAAVYGLFFYGQPTPRRLVFFIAAALVLQLPLLAVLCKGLPRRAHGAADPLGGHPRLAAGVCEHDQLPAPGVVHRQRPLLLCGHVRHLVRHFLQSCQALGEGPSGSVRLGAVRHRAGGLYVLRAQPRQSLGGARV